MIGERLTKLRKQKGLTQDDLGEMLSLANTSISSYETGGSIPTEETLITMAKIFDVSIDYLVGLIDEPYSFQRENELVLRIPGEIPEEVKQTARDFIEFLAHKYKQKQRKS